MAYFGESKFLLLHEGIVFNRDQLVRILPKSWIILHAMGHPVCQTLIQRSTSWRSSKEILRSQSTGLTCGTNRKRGH